MPSKKSAMRRVRTSERNRLYNRFWKTRCKNALKKVNAAVEKGDVAAATACLNEAQSVFDKAVVKGVLHHNNANRRKAMMAAKVKSLSPAPASEAPAAEPAATV